MQVLSVNWPLMSFTEATIARLPRVIRPFAERHHELIKFAIVGAIGYALTSPQKRGRAKAGILLNISAAVIGAVRLSLGGGII